jgi:molybdopterin/thiamine biosynthesis adenylyltransferase/molybdopterin synthase catalytic subunit/rhodanese-related sulfurtransferase
MAAFEFSDRPLDPAQLRATLEDPACGGFASFEGWVRDHNDGQAVSRLEYEAYAELAVREGERILVEAVRRFGVRGARCVHRLGALGLGELAVWVGVSSAHRGEAFAACRFIIDEVKHRLPIWKKEHYANGDSGWVNCERCAQPGAAVEPHAHAHGAPARPGARDAAAGTARADYSRQMVLPEVGGAGQARLRAARVLVVGAGGLGAPVLAYLAGAGIGTLGIVDGDVLEASNLHRQTLYALDEVGRPKALLATERLRALNPEVDVRAYVERADATSLARLAGDFDVLVDCSDNFSTHFLVNDVAVRLGKPAVLASVYQYEGQLQVVAAGGACLRCIWPEATADGLVGNCAEAGVLGPVPGALGSLQALEVLKLVLGMASPARDGLVLIDLRTLETRRIAAHRPAACAAGPCVRLPGTAPADLELPAAALGRAVAEGYTVIDVRDAHESARLPLPVPHRQLPVARLLDDPAQLPASGRYLLVCARGQRSKAAAEVLRRAGVGDAWSLRGGMAAVEADTATV